MSAAPTEIDPSRDALGTLVRFTEALRDLDFAINSDRVSSAVEMLGHWHAGGDTEPYWPLRIVLCSSEVEILRFDAAYLRWFGSIPDDAERAQVPVPVQVEARSGGDGAAGEQGTTADAGASGHGDLGVRDFDDMTDEQLREVSAWTELLRPVTRRPAMRRHRAATGDLDPARTMRLMLRNNGELLHLRHRRRTTQPRSLLMLVDTSASMRPYSEALLHFAHAAIRADPGRVEVFSVGTRYTHLTRSLTARSIDEALRTADEVHTDWDGGTTLGVALRGLLARWGGSRAVRSAIVVLGSDGFEFDEPELFLEQVARLAAVARTLIWVDPWHRGSEPRPRDPEVARAQALATTVVGCHNYEALRSLAKVITDA